jgi:hypothetical protein
VSDRYGFKNVVVSLNVELLYVFSCYYHEGVWRGAMFNGIENEYCEMKGDGNFSEVFELYDKLDIGVKRLKSELADIMEVFDFHVKYYE